MPWLQLPPEYTAGVPHYGIRPRGDLADGLDWLFVPTVAPFNLGRKGGLWTFTGLRNFYPTPLGRTYNQVNVGGGEDTSNSVSGATATNVSAFSVLLYYRIRNVGATRGLLQYATAAGSGSPRLLLQNDNGTSRLYWATSYRITETRESGAGSIRCDVITVNGSAVEWYCNGRLVGTASATASNTGSAIWFNNGFQYPSQSEYALGAYWENRALDPVTARALSGDPCGLAQPTQRRIFVPVVESSLETRYGRPISDIQAQWTPSTGSDNYAMLDEASADDADYVYTTGAAVDVYKCTSMDLSGATTPQITLRVPTGFTPSGQITLGLYEGNPLVSGTLIAELEVPTPAAGTEYTHTLTGGEITALTAADGTDLYWRLEGMS